MVKNYIGSDQLAISQYKKFQYSGCPISHLPTRLHTSFMATTAHSVLYYDVCCLYSFLCSLCVYGGGNRREQINKVGKGVEIVIGEIVQKLLGFFPHIP